MGGYAKRGFIQEISLNMATLATIATKIKYANPTGIYLKHILRQRQFQVDLKLA